MNIEKLFESLDACEKDWMIKVVANHNKMEAEKLAKEINLTEDEKQLIFDNNIVAAIKAVRDRTGHTLNICRIVVDNYRGYY